MGIIRVLLTSVAIVLPQAAEGGSAPGNGNRLVMATYWGDDRVALIDIEAAPGQEELWSIDTLQAVGCAKPYDVRVNRRGDEAYVTCSGSNQIAVIDVLAQQIRYTLETGSSPRDLQLFDDDRRLIVANSGSDTVSVIDTQSRRKLYDFSVSSQPYGVAVARDGRTAFITGWASGDLHIVRLGTSSATSVGTVPVGFLPYTVVAPGEGHVAYVAANGSQRVVAVDSRSRLVTAQIPVGRNPWSIAASVDGQQLLVTNNRSNNLSLLRTGAAASPASPGHQFISAGTQPRENGQAAVRRAPKNASFSANGSSAVFTDLANNQIVVVDVASGGIRRVINVGRAPYGVEFIR